MLVDNKKIIKKIFSNFNLPIAVHCEDEKVIKSNLDKLKLEFGDKVPMYFHPKLDLKKLVIYHPLTLSI